MAANSWCFQNLVAAQADISSFVSATVLFSIALILFFLLWIISSGRKFLKHKVLWILTLWILTFLGLAQKWDQSLSRGDRFMIQLGMKTLFVSLYRFSVTDWGLILTKTLWRGFTVVVSAESIQQKMGFPSLELSGMCQHWVYFQKRVFILLGRGGNVQCCQHFNEKYRWILVRSHI